MKGKKKALEVQPKAVTCWMLRGPSDIHPGLGFWWYEGSCRDAIAEHGYKLMRPIQVRIVPVLPKKRGARR